MEKTKAKELLKGYLKHGEDELKSWFDSFKNPRKWNDYNNIKKEEEWQKKMEHVKPIDDGMPVKYTSLSPEKTNEVMAFSEVVEILSEKKNPGKKFKKVMREFGQGKLHSGSKKGPIVTDYKQAVAIAYSEQREANKK